MLFKDISSSFDWTVLVFCYSFFSLMAIILWFWYKINALQACTYCKTFSCASCIMVCLWCLNQITVYSLFKEKKLFFFFFYCSGGYLWTSFYKAAFCNWEDWHSPSFCSPDSCRWVLLYVLELFLCVCLFEIVYWQFSSFFSPYSLKTRIQFDIFTEYMIEGLVAFLT